MSTTDNIYFIQEMKKRLNADMRSCEYGCKISDIEVRLGSKMAVDTFYEAELLFQNIGNVRRFAQLIAEDLLNHSTALQNKSVFVLGYEDYSAVLVQEIVELLKNEASTVEWLVYSQENKEHGLFDRFDPEYRKQLFNGDVICVPVIPVGTTMSTIYKLQEKFEIAYKKARSDGGSDVEINYNYYNYCLVAVGNFFCDVKVAIEKDEFELINRYIDINGYIKDRYRENNSPKNSKSDQQLWKTVPLQPSKKQDDTVSNNNNCVKLLIGVPAKWRSIYPENEKQAISSSDETKSAGDVKPQLYVSDKVGLVNAVFQSRLPELHYSYYNRDNQDSKTKPIDILAPRLGIAFLRYGHIVHGDNHYQFYFDFNRITENILKEHKNSFDSWCKKYREKIEANAFNIVISPLQVANSAFLKYIIDNVFGSNLHLLHIDINGTKKEAVRTKYSYIINELRDIEEMGEKVNFYYIDDSVCTGSGLNRAHKFLKLLWDQAHDQNNGKAGGNEPWFKFKKVFLLVNRSSYDTANEWVDDPNDDWVGFINICVPSYNTHSGTCPGCRVRERFDRLKKRSVTNDLVADFCADEEKHLLRTVDDFDIWKEHSILTKPSYFNWLKLYVFYHRNENEDIFNNINDFSNNKTPEEWHKQTIDKFLNHIKKRYEKERKKGYNILYNKLKDRILDLVYKIINDDNFCRLKTMDNAYRELVYNRELGDIYNKCVKINNYREYENALKDKILSILTDAFKDKGVYEGIMEFISYIKVISRDYLASNYFVRKAVLNILRSILGGLVGTRTKNESDSEIEKKLSAIETYIRLEGSNTEEKTICEYLQLRLFNLIVHRLALMHDSYVIDDKFITGIYIAYNRMLKRITEYKKKFVPLPTIDKVMLKYVASIKTVSMYYKDDSMCWRITELCKKLDGKINYKKNKRLNDFKQYCIRLRNLLYLENTRAMFYFAEELSSEVTGFGNKIDENWEYEGYDGYGGLKKRNEIIDKLDTKIAECVPYDKGNKLLYQNKFQQYLDRYEDIFGKGNEEKLKGLGWFVNYYNITCFLAESEYGEKRAEKFHNLTYIYEDLCMTLAELTRSDNCYIIYRKDGEDSQIVSRTYCINEDKEFFGDTESIDNDERTYGVNIGHKGFNSIIKLFNDEEDTFKKEESKNDSFNKYKKNKLVKCSTKNNALNKEEKNAIEKYIVNNNAPNKHQNNMIINDDKNNIVKNKKNRAKIYFPGIGEVLICENKVNKKFSVIKMPLNLMQDRQKNDGRYFYIVLENSCENKEEFDDKQFVGDTFYKVLFLKNRLWEALRADYARLMNFRYHCAQVEPITEKKDERYVLHISDLHIGRKALDWKKSFKYYDSSSPELLAVTGDIVDASTDASNAQKRYTDAGDILFKLIKDIWGIERLDNKKGSDNKKMIYLPYDWRRRVLITTGNHDYAAMNDTSVQTKERKVSVATPAQSSAGTMSKFTYLIEFLAKFLDAPPKRLIEDDLNDIRHYKYLGREKNQKEGGLTVGIFNTSSKVNALQNNKVGVNEHIVDRLLDDMSWGEDCPHIALMHHAPSYVKERMDYFNDKYEYWECRDRYVDLFEEKLKDNKKKEFEDAYKSFLDVLQKCGVALTKRGKALKSIYQGSNFENKVGDILERPELSEFPLIADMKRLRELDKLKDGEPLGEYLYKLLTEAFTLTKTMKEDKKGFDRFYDSIKEKIENNKLVVLAGHEHKTMETDSEYIIEKMHISETGVNDIYSGKLYIFKVQGAEDFYVRYNVTFWEYVRTYRNI